MDEEKVPEPLPKRADELVVGDRIEAAYLPSTYATGPGEVILVKSHVYRGNSSVFVAYVHADGYYDSTSYLPDGILQVHPAMALGHDYTRADDDPETTQPIAGRVPAHLEDAVTGEVVVVGGAKPLQFCNGAPVDYAADCGELGPHGPHGPGSVRGAR